MWTAHLFRRNSTLVGSLKLPVLGLLPFFNNFFGNHLCIGCLTIICNCLPGCYWLLGKVIAKVATMELYRRKYDQLVTVIAEKIFRISQKADF